MTDNTIIDLIMTGALLVSFISIALLIIKMESYKAEITQLHSDVYHLENSITEIYSDLIDIKAMKSPYTGDNSKWYISNVKNSRR